MANTIFLQKEIECTNSEAHKTSNSISSWQLNVSAPIMSTRGNPAISGRSNPISPSDILVNFGFDSEIVFYNMCQRHSISFTQITLDEPQFIGVYSIKLTSYFYQRESEAIDPLI